MSGRIWDRRGAWAWIVGAALPWLGLISLKLLVNQAGEAFNKPVARINVFDRWQQDRYRQLLGLRRIATPLVLVAWLAGAVAKGSGLSLILFPVGIVGLFVALYAEIRLRPFRKAIKEAGGVKVWFSSTSDTVAAYESNL